MCDFQTLILLEINNTYLVKLHGNPTPKFMILKRERDITTLCSLLRGTTECVAEGFISLPL